MEDKTAFTQKRYKPSLPNIEFSIPKTAYAKLPGHIKRHFPKNRFTVAYLLTTDTAKAKKAQKRRWLNAVLYLTPSTKIGLPGVNLCGAESTPCRIACLDDSGRLGRALAQRAMAARTLFLILHQDSFVRLLLHEVAKLDGFAERTLPCRLQARFQDAFGATRSLTATATTFVFSTQRRALSAFGSSGCWTAAAPL